MNMLKELTNKSFKVWRDQGISGILVFTIIGLFATKEKFIISDLNLGGFTVF